MTDQSQIVDLMLVESDKRIAAQIQLMLAADARSVGLLAASSTLGAAGLAVTAAQFSPAGNVTTALASAAFTAFAIASALSCVWALIPEPVHIVGWSPSLFDEDLKTHKSIFVIKAEMVALNQEKIEANARQNERISRRVLIAIALLGIAPVFATGVLLGSRLSGL